MKLNITQKNTTPFKIEKPTLLGTYRTDKPLPFSTDNLNELYLRYDPCHVNKPINLEKGFNNQTTKQRLIVHNKFESLLEWLKSNKHLLETKREENNNKISMNHKSFNPLIVASPGLLALLIKCPYELEYSFQLLGELFNGTIYLKMKKKFQKNFNDFEITNYCEKKFRQHLTEKMQDDDFEESRLNQWVSFGSRKVIEKKSHDVSEKITFVFRNKIKKHTVIFAEEIDCFEQMNKFEKDEFGIVKCKLARKPQPFESRNDYFYSIRKLRWWSQCVLCSVKRLVIGWWSYDHRVEEIKSYSLDELKSSSLFCQNVCLNNLNQILSFIKDGFKKLETNTICLTHSPYSNELVCTNSFFKVLPSSYKESFDFTL